MNMNIGKVRSEHINTSLDWQWGIVDPLPFGKGSSPKDMRCSVVASPPQLRPGSRG
jgi:hypothetical protein